MPTRIGFSRDSRVWTAAAVLGVAAPAGGQCEVARLVASDATSADSFGFAVAARDDMVLIAATRGDGDEADVGSVYVFTPEGTEWIERSELHASDGARHDSFGWSLAVDGEILIVGAPSDDDLREGAGSAYVFRFDGASWSEEAKLLASDGAEGDRFGISVAVSGDTVLVGAYHDDEGGADAGAAYVFRLENDQWVEEAKLVAGDPAVEALFGRAVAINGDRAIVGAPSDADETPGRAHAFRRVGSAWDETHVLAGDGMPEDLFGQAVAMRGDVALVGAPGDGEEHAGSAYLYRHDGSAWTRTARLAASDRATEQVYGWSVALGDGVGLVGAAFALPGGAAYFVRTEGPNAGEEIARVVGAEVADTDLFGASVTVAGAVAVIGAYKSDDAGNASGSAYVYEVDGPDCNGNDRPDCLEIMSGESADCNGDGIPDECAGDGSGPIALARRTIRVPEDAGTIQEAIDLASDGDEVVVANGIYRGEGNRDIDFDGKAIVLRSEDCDPDRCVIDCERRARGFTFASGEPRGTLLAGFTVLNAIASGGNGAGISCLLSEPTITDCVLRGCVASRDGGGLASDTASPTVLRCRFEGNRALGIDGLGGGGVVARDEGVLTLAKCRFTGNSARTAGGGVTIAGLVDATLTDCAFEANSADTGGGAVYAESTADVALTRCRFVVNGTAFGIGGAVLAIFADMRVAECVFEENYAADAGGGMANYESSPEIEDSTFVANTAVNEGGGLWGHMTAARITGCLFDGNRVAGEGGGVFEREGSPVIVGCTFRANVAAAGGGLMGVDGPVGPIVSMSLFCENDPDHIAGTYRDDGGNRFLDECQCPADLDDDGTVGFNDLVMVLDAWGNEGGPEDLDGSGSVDFEDLLIVLDSWGPCE